MASLPEDQLLKTNPEKHARKYFRRTKDVFNGYTGTLTSVTIPAVIGNVKMRELGMHSFISDTVQTLKIADGYQTIEAYAFNYGSYEKVFLPDSIEDVSFGAFCNCQKLRYVRWPRSLNQSQISSSVFEKCPAIENIDTGNPIVDLSCKINICYSPDKEFVLPEEYPFRLDSDVSFHNWPNLKWLQVDSNHPQYASFAGCVYTKDMKKLVCKPAAVQDYVIPRDAEDILLNIRLFGLKSMSVEEGSKHFRVVDGVLYSYDLTKLLCIPHYIDLKTIQFPKTVTNFTEDQLSLVLRYELHGTEGDIARVFYLGGP